MHKQEEGGARGVYTTPPKNEKGTQSRVLVTSTPARMSAFVLPYGRLA